MMYVELQRTPLQNVYWPTAVITGVNYSILVKKWELNCILDGRTQAFPTHYGSFCNRQEAFG
jgi:hypothetical protein